MNYIFFLVMNYKMNYNLLLIAVSVFWVISCGAPKVAQVPELQTEVGGDALKGLHRAGNGEYSEFIKEYIRISEKYSDSDLFDDYLADGNQYTVFVPNNAAVADFWANYTGRAWDKDNTLRNTIKYAIVKGKMSPSDFTGKRTLQSLWTWNKSRLSVSTSNGDIVLTDMKNNKVTLGEPLEFGNVIFYPVKTFLRY